MSAVVKAVHPLPEHITPEYLAAPTGMVRAIRGRWLIAGLIGAVLAIVGFVTTMGGDQVAHERFWRAYLVGFMFCLGLTCGSMALLMLQHVTGGKWGLVIRRLLEAGTRTWWFTFLLFILFALAGAKYLYPWGGHIPQSEHALRSLAARGSYSTYRWWTIRGVLYFLGWGVFIYIMNAWSPLQDSAPPSWKWANDLRIRFMRLGGAGLLFYSLTISLAAIDWVMSLDAVWYSTIWGMIYMVGQALAALAFAICVLVMLARVEPLRSLLRKTELHDNGKLLLAFVMLYTYLSFSQFIIIWSGNLPEEITWYIARVRAGWKPIMLFLVIFHFAVPFLLLLNRNLKKHGPKLMFVASGLLVVRIVDLFWHVVPNFADENILAGGHFYITWMDVLIPASMASLWITLFFFELPRRPLLIAYHPSFPEILESSHGGH